MRALIFLLSLLLVVLCRRAASAPQYIPGSWVGVLADWQPATSSSDLYIALWDGTTGQNYTSLVARDQTFFSFIPTTAERVIAISLQPPGWTSTTASIAVLKYAPQSAPVLASPICQLPPYALQSNPFVLNGVLYALTGNILYRIETPTDENDTCQLTVLAPLPITYSQFCSLYLSKNHAAYITGTTLVELWYSEETQNFTITSQQVPRGMAGTWVWLQEDSSTGVYYYHSTTSDYHDSFWNGTRNSTHGAIKWTEMLDWKGKDPGSFTIDSRDESAFNGPLFCSTDGISDSYCWTLDGQQAWAGPQLKAAFPPSGSGAASYTYYDPNCSASHI